MSADNPEQKAPQEILSVGENVREDSQINQFNNASFKGGVADKMQAVGNIKDAGFTADSDLLGDQAISKMSPEQVRTALVANEQAIGSERQNISNLEKRLASVGAAQGQAEITDRNNLLARARESK